MTQRRDKNQTKQALLRGYYGVLQTIHFSGLLWVVFFGGREKALLSVSSDLVGRAADYMMVSAYLDLLISAPLGIIGVFGKKVKLLKISLIAAVISAVVYVVVLLGFGVWEWSTGNIIILVIFSPMVLLLRMIKCRK